MVEQLLQERCGRQLSACVRMNTRLTGVEFELNCGKKQGSRRSTTEHKERGHMPGMFDREDIDLDMDLKYHLQTCTCSCNHMGFGNYMDYYQVSWNVQYFFTKYRLTRPNEVDCLGTIFFYLKKISTYEKSRCFKIKRSARQWKHQRLLEPEI